MEKTRNELVNLSEAEAMDMLHDTSRLMAQYSVNQLSSAAVAAQESNVLANDVEFWQWMGRNYSKSGIFNTPESMQNYIAQGAGKQEWFQKQLQGKGFEWDWMTQQRGEVRNIFNTYDAGDVANRAASDVTQRNLLTGKSSEYQMKAYTSKTNPNLKNTPKDMTVVTNAEKVDIVKGNGYNSVEEFGDANAIKRATQKRMDQVKSGKVYSSYNFKNVAGTMTKAGAIGCVVGMGTEAVLSYRRWKQGNLSTEAYIKEIAKSGGDVGLTGAATAGLMVPVTSTITAVGVSSVVTIPIAFVIGGAVNKVVAPCFGRGAYREILSNVRYYQNLEMIYDDLVRSMDFAAREYYDFLQKIGEQGLVYQKLNEQSQKVNQDLQVLYEQI